MAALTTRNDGECHLQRNEEGFYEYFRSPEQVWIVFFADHIRCAHAVCCMICEEQKGNRIGEKVGSDRAGKAFVNITQAAPQHSCSPILGTLHASTSVCRRVFFSMACIHNLSISFIL